MDFQWFQVSPFHFEHPLSEILLHFIISSMRPVPAQLDTTVGLAAQHFLFHFHSFDIANWLVTFAHFQLQLQQQ